ncbi:MAG: ATP-dependent helicase/nuclease subunit B [Pirellulaceae bacterium]|jgi:ATP-dependent helicase/nuclease subunit B
MGITRKFLDWSSPALPAAVDYLIASYVQDGRLDLDQVLVVLPGRRAGRRLLEILVSRCEEAKLILLPPLIETVGQLPEKLYESKRPMASELVQQLAWIHALRKVGSKRLRRHIRELPEDNDIARWLALGKLLWQQHRELAADGIDFADVMEQGSDANGFNEKLRWRFLKDVQRHYLNILDQLELWDRQTARLYAIEHNECKTDRDMVFVATSDMNRALRQMIDQIEDRVTILVHAPLALSNRFDKYGCIEPDNWHDIDLDISGERVTIVENINDQATEVARQLLETAGDYRADEIAIGILDESASPQIERQLAQCGVATRSAVGRKVSQTRPYRLLQSVARYLERRRYNDFAALARHPDVFDWICRQGIETGWIDQLDHFYNNHLTPQLGEWFGVKSEWDRLKQVYDAIEALLKPLVRQPLKLGKWPERILQFLLAAYDGIEFDKETEEGHFALESCKEIQAALLEHEEAPDRLTPRTSCGQAIRLCLEQLQGVQIRPMPNEDAIELIGWLELPLDTAERLIVTSFNEGFVPKSVNSDLFLPDGLRKQLNLLDNRRRFARDAYAMSSILANRPDTELIIPRRDAQSDPLNPSRLLFATAKENVADRALKFFDNSPPAVELPGTTHGSFPEHSSFFVPLPQPLDEPVGAMGVTAFRSYLACPYRFYLRHVLHLEPMNDDAEELSAASFGSLAHEVLREFGESEYAAETHPIEIQNYLNSVLEQKVAGWYGTERLPAVNVQLMQLRTRLSAFAQWQAEWAKQGWRIQYIESEHKSLQTTLEVAAGTMQIYGRIDRIDYHPEFDQWMIFDYKTSDSPSDPNKAHRTSKGEWVDLQLPLYRQLAQQLDVPLTAKTGYIVLPKDTRKVGELLAPWSAEELRTADELAHEIVADVLQQKFWPPTEPAPNILTDFKAICQDGVFQRQYGEVPMQEAKV